MLCNFQSLTSWFGPAYVSLRSRPVLFFINYFHSFVMWQATWKTVDLVLFIGSVLVFYIYKISLKCYYGVFIAVFSFTYKPAE